MEELVYLNGDLVPRSQAKVSIFDHGFLYGYGVFETMRAYNGKLLLLDCHIERLRNTAERIGMPPLAALDLAGACRETITANKLTNARLRLTVTRGEPEAYPGKRGSGTPNVIVTARSYTPPPPEVYAKGYRALIASYRQNSQGLGGVKSNAYLLLVLARMEAQEAGCDEAILLNARGAIAEGSATNVFFVAEGRLLTPPLRAGILPGVTRQAVIELAQAEGIPCEETDVRPRQLSQCREAFLTNSVIGLMPLAELSYGSRKLAAWRLGPVTKRLIAAYDRLVKAQTGYG